MRNVIPRFIHEKYEEGIFEGSFNAATMFVDISGFTSITESLMRRGTEGAERISSMLNEIFNPIIYEVYRHAGFITGFAGDAFTAVYPDANPFKPLFTALAIQERFASRKEESSQGQLSVKIGLSYGEVLWGIVGGEERKAYYFRGEPVAGCAKAIEDSQPGQIVLDDNLYNSLTMTSPDPARIVIPPPQEEISSQTSIISQSVVEKFVPRKVLLSKRTGEFREVASVFISFREIPNFFEMPQFVETVLEKSYQYGGYLNSLNFEDKGPSLLVLFGAPVSHENNVKRAADFALDVRKEFRFVVRTGITAGAVYAGAVGSPKRSTYTALGDAVNLAARFMTASDWGEIWISSEVARRLGNSYATEAKGSHRFKGKSEPCEVFGLLDPQIRPAGELFTGEMVGRDKELTQAKDFTHALDQGRFGGVINIYGEAGIGKSRLLFELAGELGKKVQTCVLKTDEVLRKGLNPFIYYFKGFFNQADVNTTDVNKENFETAWRDLLCRLEEAPDNERVEPVIAELRRTKSIFGGLLGLRWPGSLFEKLDALGRFDNTVYAIKEFFKGISLAKPVMIILEDAQWLDADSSQVFKVLTRNLDDYPIVIYTTSRFADDGSKPRIELEVPQQEIVIDYLDQDSVATFVCNQLGAEADDGLLSFIKERTEGNPFFAEQFCLYLKENELIERSNGKYSKVKGKAEIPGGIKSILVSRLDRLSAGLKDTVQTASVLGREFDVAILAAMLARRRLEVLLDEGETEGIWTALTEIIYIFKHALMRDAAYGMQLRKRLNDLHKLAAEAMERFYAADPTHYADIAFHYEQAETNLQAKVYLERAADYARETFKNEEAIDLYNRLLALLDDRGKAISTQSNKASILQLIGRWQEAETIYRDNLKKAEEAGNRILQADNANSLGLLLRGKGAFDEAGEFFSMSREIYTDMGNKLRAATVTGNIGGIGFMKGDLRDALECFQEWLAAGEEFEDKKEISKSLSNIGIIHAMVGEREKALEYFERSLAITEELDDPQGLAATLGNMAIVFSNTGQYDKALEMQQRALEIAKEMGNKQGISTTMSGIGFIYEARQDYPKALKYYRSNLEINQELGNKRSLGIAYGNIGNVYARMESYDKALEYYTNQLEIARSLADEETMCKALGNSSIAYKELGNFEKARDHNDKAVEIARQRNLKSHLAVYLCESAGLSFREGDIQAAATANCEALKLAEETHNNDVAFTSRLFNAQIAAKEDKNKAVLTLEDLLKSELQDWQRAALYHELYKLTGKDEHRKSALDLYRKLHEKTSRPSYAKKIAELKGSP
ncbi:tetratricopeptide repeat protein [candidate division WOR-3 bacterium]|nr:tetratricopeptide repeat protein [candidate division WOR-3 bacterium]